MYHMLISMNHWDWYEQIYRNSIWFAEFERKQLLDRPYCEYCGRYKSETVEHRHFTVGGKSILGFESKRDVVALCGTCAFKLRRERYALNTPIERLKRWLRGFWTNW